MLKFWKNNHIPWIAIDVVIYLYPNLSWSLLFKGAPNRWMEMYIYLLNYCYMAFLIDWVTKFFPGNHQQITLFDFV